jgi:membrane protein DedA with SNARE-associated domain
MNLDLQWLDIFWETLQSGGFQEWGRWNYLVLFVLIAVEGPLATLLGAAAASAGFMRLWLVILVAVTANLLADIGWYTLGYVSREETLIRYFGWLGLRSRHLDKLRWGMRRHARKVLLVAKFSTGFAIPALVAAGLSRIPLRRWFPVVLFAGIGWSSSLALIGFYATEMIKQVSLGLHYLALFGLAAAFVLVLFLVRRSMNSTRSFVEEIDNGISPLLSGRVSLPAADDLDPSATSGD